MTWKKMWIHSLLWQILLILHLDIINDNFIVLLNFKKQLDDQLQSLMLPAVQEQI